MGLGSPPCGRDDYGALRERSGITRAAVLPALSALCQSEGLEDACSSLLRNPTHWRRPAALVDT